MSFTRSMKEGGSNCFPSRSPVCKLSYIAEGGSIRYCGVKCQRDHRPKHKKECKKRAGKLRDEVVLFKQPESSCFGNCPICCVPAYLSTKIGFGSCCSKLG